MYCTVLLLSGERGSDLTWPGTHNFRGKAPWPAAGNVFEGAKATCQKAISEQTGLSFEQSSS